MGKAIVNDVQLSGRIIDMRSHSNGGRTLFVVTVEVGGDFDERHGLVAPIVRAVGHDLGGEIKAGDHVLVSGSLEAHAGNDGRPRLQLRLKGVQRW